MRRNDRAVLAAIVLAVAIVAFLLMATLGAKAQARSRCHHGTSVFAAPDNACTPGAYVILSRATVCTAKDRPNLSAADRRKVVTQYGVPGWTGASGELDHRVPVFLGGLTVEDNIWPEPGSIPNPKDRLEVLVRSRVCGSATGYRPALATMRVRTAVRLFLADWRHAYRALVARAG